VGAPARAASLPTVASGARPGPDLLYAPAPDAPQLQNAGVWKAPPILVSGAEAYRDGEFLYQDFLFDDHGATASADDPNDPFNQLENMFSPKHGTLSYPTDTATFANNAADLVELRVKPLADTTAIRVTLNTLKAPDRTAFTIAIGDSSSPLSWPHGAGVRSPAQLFLTVHGTSAELLDATGHPVTPTPTAAVDLARRQIDVRVPHAAWDPGKSTVRMTAGVGLWDPAADSYLTPGPVATATNPGGVSASGAALFNMAFRTDEPVPHINYPGTANTIVEGHVGVVQDGAWWRERRQGDVLASGDVTPFGAQVDFAKLASRTADESAVPKAGHLDRIFASHFSFGQGADFNAKCLTSTEAECTGRYVGQLQPYGLYVPHKPVPRQGFGLVISMHGLSANHNEFLGSNEASEMGERGSGSIFASPLGRGPDGSYASYAEADVFEMWADVARHYRLNPALTDITGYSMGGLGTWRLAGRWPDLFARAFPIVGPGTTADFDESMRNVPVMAWHGQNDELANPATVEAAFAVAEQAGIRYDHWVFAPAGHITIGNNDEFGPAVQFFGDHTVDRDPAHVTYVFNPAEDPKALSATDHAYWLSGLKLSAGKSSGKIDARSRAAGVGDPPVEPVKPSAGTLNGGSHGPLPYTRRTIEWGPAPKQAKANALDLTTTGLSAVTVDAPRAGVGCDAALNVKSDGPLKVTLGGCDVTTTVRSGRTRVCASRRGFVIHLPRRVHGRRVLRATVRVGTAKARTVRGKRLALRISLRGRPKQRVRVRIVSRLAGGRRAVTTRTYRTCVRRPR
jgi:predicted esterase